MAITFNIPDTAWALMMDSTGDIVSMGSFTSQIGGVLRNIKAAFYKNNCTGLFRMRLHTSPDQNTNYAVSEWVDIEDVSDASFRGNIRFDFNRCVLTLGKKYWVSVESDDYTRDGDSEYMCFLLDSPMTTNVTIGDYPTDFPAAMEIFHK